MAVKTLAAALEAQIQKDSEKTTVFVRVRNGVAYVFGEIDGMRVYIETRVGDAASSARVRVSPFIENAQKKIAPVVQGVVARKNRLSDTIATGPVGRVGVKVHNGVVYIRCTVGATTLSLQQKASSTWAMTTARVTQTYSSTRLLLEDRVAKPIYDRTDAVVTASKNLVNPYLVRAKDGTFYIRTTVGNTIVNVKLTANQRVLTPALETYAAVRSMLTSYTGAALEKALSAFESTKQRLNEILAPLLEKGGAAVTYSRTTVNSMLVEVKTKAATGAQKVRNTTSTVYIKFKNGYMYVYGLAGDKVLYVKVSIEQLAKQLTSKVLAIGNEALARANAAKLRVTDRTAVAIEATKTKASSASELTRAKASELKTKAGEMASDRSCQVTAAGAVSGGATGLATGTVAGAIVGVVPAAFTFGLSIPLFAAAGGATGLCTGSVAGGVAARKIHANQDEIKGGVATIMSKANTGKEYLLTTASCGKQYISEKAKGCTDYMGDRTMMVKNRLVGGTGGTAVDSD